ncbi:MAG: ABC transporter ATP-binding protein [Verrucomicrobiaceae bacterium]|nr:MAG: ABC transporter ATP-binding protein [Verrucomicrobiaceae bacterium]
MSDGLHLKDVTIQFGGLKAVSGLSFEVPPGGIFGLIGPNGAGKTTVFNLITGVYRPTAGDIIFNGISLPGHPPHRITPLGIARTFQNIRLFPSLSVFDNVRCAMGMHLRGGMGSALLRGSAWREEEATVDTEIMDLLEIFDLGSLRNEKAVSLPYGDQRRLEIVRALATRPKLLLLDEPAAGMNPTEKEVLMNLIRFIRDKFDISIMLVEHDMKVVMGICQHIAVLEYGIKIAEGTPKEIQCHPRVIEAYLGVCAD